MLELKLEAHAGALPLHRGWLSGRYPYPYPYPYP